MDAEITKKRKSVNRNTKSQAASVSKFDCDKKLHAMTLVVRSRQPSQQIWFSELIAVHEKESRMSKWFYALVATVICFIGILVILYYKAIWLPGFTDHPAAYGQMGDFFGGLLNPVLAFASFMALLYTIQIQSKQLEISANELKETKEEIAASRKAQEDLSNTQLTQLFENNFFSQMNYIAGIKESFRKHQQDQVHAVSDLVANENPITLSIDMVVSNSPQARMYYSTVLELLRYVDEFMYKSNSWDKASMYLHASADSDHSFRSNPITHFGLIRSPISVLSDHF